VIKIAYKVILDADGSIWGKYKTKKSAVKRKKFLQRKYSRGYWYIRK